MPISPTRSKFKDTVTGFVALGLLGSVVLTLSALTDWGVSTASVIPLQNWVTVPGQASDIYLTCGRGTATSQHGTFTYTYQGVNYVGHSPLPVNGYQCTTGVMAERLTHELAGQAVTVYVNPEHPERAVLVRRMPPFAPVGWPLLTTTLLWLALRRLTPDDPSHENSASLKATGRKQK